MNKDSSKVNETSKNDVSQKDASKINVTDNNIKKKIEETNENKDKGNKEDNNVLEDEEINEYLSINVHIKLIFI